MTATVAGAARVLERADELARCSARPGAIERSYLTTEHADANRLAAGWMAAAGLEVRTDPAGNLVGRFPTDGDAPVVLLGSHLDSVPDAGRYDGILGVLVAIEVAERLRYRGLPFGLEVVAFGDEEGTRFGATLLGSRALAGGWRDEWLDLTDADGTTLAEAARAFGLDPARMGEAARPPGSVLAYLEAHIEQGPRLERAGRPLGAVTAIAAAERRRIVLRGEARHAATPRELRRDALLGAAEAILAIDRIADERDCFSTVGRIAVEPDAVNVVPGAAVFSLDLRAPTEAARDAAWGAIRHELHRIAGERDLDLEVESIHRAAEVACASHLREAIAAGIRATGDVDPMDLVSIAGHDAMAIAGLAPVGMLFVRCGGGISHHPDESVTEPDVEASIDALEAAVLEFARSR